MLKMRRGRPTTPIQLTERQRGDLEQIARSRSLPAGLVRRAKIILLAADGHCNTDIAKKVGITGSMVGYWRKRFLAQGLEGLGDQPRPGRPRTIEDERIAEVIRETLESKPKDATQWSCRSMAQKAGLSKSTVHRVWKAFSLQPHRQKHFKLSTDPHFVEKVRDIVALYLNPPDNALVLCVDEKSPVQALERTQPLLPLGLGHAEGVTHDYVRHGTTTLFAALEVATGKVLAQCKPRHRHQEFLAFLKHIDSRVEKDLDVHLIVDNYATHKHEKVRRWLAARPRYHVHFVPTYSSWLNQVETWFNIITRKAIRRGSDRSVKELVERIERFVKSYNKYCNPFVWLATADSILGKVERLCKTISGTQH
jgi:putative transposase